MRCVLVDVSCVDGVGYVRVRGCGHTRWLLAWSSGSSGCLLVGDLCVFTGVGGVAGCRLGRLACLGCLLVDDFCGAGVGFSSVRGCGRGCWPSSRSPRCLRVVASRVDGVSLGGVRLRSRMWVVVATRKDV